MDDNKKLPSGWGEDDDEDFGFSTFDDEDDEDSPWGTASNSANNKKSIVAEKQNDECEAYSDNRVSDDEAENKISGIDYFESITEKNIESEKCRIKGDDTEDNSSDSDISIDEQHSETTWTSSSKNSDDSLVQQDIISEQEKKSINGAVVGIIIFLIFAVVFLGWLLIRQSRNTDDNSNVPVQNVNSQQTDEVYTTQAEEATENETEEVTIEASTEDETTVATEPQTEAATVPYEVYEEASIRALDEFMQTYYGNSAMYGLFDVNGDSVPELFLEYDTEASSRSFLYVYNGVDYVEQLDLDQGGTRICTSEHLIEAEGYGGAYVRTIYVMDDTGNINVEAEIRSEALKNYLNDQQISESEYNDLHNYYDSKQWVEVGCYEYKRENAKPQNSIISPDDPYYEIKQEILYSVDNEYYSGKNSHIENATDDMVFYAVGNRSNIEITNPKVYSGPGTNYSAIEVYTNNFYIVGENNSWYYIEWIDGAGAFSHSCYGYLEKNSMNSSEKEYTPEEIKRNAGSDFYFYDTPPYSYGRTVNTESVSLNLRAAPSTSADIIAKIPKGAYVGEFGCNAEWSYISYTDENGVSYVGFVSSQYLY